MTCGVIPVQIISSRQTRRLRLQIGLRAFVKFISSLPHNIGNMKIKLRVLRRVYAKAAIVLLITPTNIQRQNTRK